MSELLDKQQQKEGLKNTSGFMQAPTSQLKSSKIKQRKGSVIDCKEAEVE